MQGGCRGNGACTRTASSAPRQARISSQACRGERGGRQDRQGSGGITPRLVVQETCEFASVTCGSLRTSWRDPIVAQETCKFAFVTPGSLRTSWRDPIVAQETCEFAFVTAPRRPLPGPGGCRIIPRFHGISPGPPSPGPERTTVTDHSPADKTGTERIRRQPIDPLPTPPHTLSHVSLPLPRDGINEPMCLATGPWNLDWGARTVRSGEAIGRHAQ